MMRRGLLGLCCGLLLLSLGAPSSQATLVISFEPAGPVNMLPGESLTVNVLISSTEDQGQPLSLASLGLQVEGFPGAIGSVLFSDTQPTAFLTDTNYVFNGVSAAEQFGFDFWSDPAGPVNFISGSDLAFDPSLMVETEVPVGSQPLLLAQFTIQASAGALGSFYIYLDSETTGFYLSDLTTNITYQGNRLVINVVPEPSSFVLAGLGVGLLVVVSRRRAHRAF